MKMLFIFCFCQICLKVISDSSSVFLLKFHFGFISEQKLLEESEHQLQAQQQRCDAAKEHLAQLTKALGTIRAGVEHVAEKLQHVALVKTHTELNDLLSQCFHHLCLSCYRSSSRVRTESLTCVQIQMSLFWSFWSSVS